MQAHLDTVTSGINANARRLLSAKTKFPGLSSDQLYYVRTSENPDHPEAGADHSVDSASHECGRRSSEVDLLCDVNHDTGGNRFANYSGILSIAAHPTNVCVRKITGLKEVIPDTRDGSSFRQQYIQIKLLGSCYQYHASPSFVHEESTEPVIGTRPAELFT